MKICFCLGLSITSHVESFDRFRTVVFEKDNYVIEILNENRTTKNIYIYKYMPLSSLLAWYCMILLYMFISLKLMKKVNDNTQIPQYFLHKGTSNMHQNKQLCVTNVLSVVIQSQ